MQIVLQPPCAEEVAVLMQLFPVLDRTSATHLLREKGSLERAASAMVDGGRAVTHGWGRRDYYDDAIPSFFRCPKCFSPELIDAQYRDDDGVRLLVCGKCHHHFPESRAKKGAAHAVGGGARHAAHHHMKPHKKKAPPQPQARGARDKKGKKFDACRKKLKDAGRGDLAPLERADSADAAVRAASGSSASTTPCAAPLSPSVDTPLDGMVSPASGEDSEGRVMKRLMEARAAREANPTLRLCVSHTGSPKLKRVITIPMDATGFTSLLKQARAKYNLRKPLRGARLLPDGIPIVPEEILNVPQGAEVLVTFTNDIPGHAESKKKGADRARPARTAASSEDVATPTVPAALQQQAIEAAS